MRLSPVPARLTALLVGLGLIAAAGCGRSTGKLTGKVTYQGNPLKGGNVTLIPTGSGKTFTARIQEDGTYTIDPIESGSYKVCVETASLMAGQSAGPGAAPGGRPGGPGPKIKNVPPPGAKLPEGYQMATDPMAGQAEQVKRYVAIPTTYADPEKTPLTVDVKGGTQPHDIPLS